MVRIIRNVFNVWCVYSRNICGVTKKFIHFFVVNYLKNKNETKSMQQFIFF